MSQKIQIRRDTAANWTSVNPVLAVGEPCFETDTGKLKIGDGRAWGVTPYQGGEGGSVDLSGYVPRVSARPVVIEAAELMSRDVGITLLSKYQQYTSSIKIDASNGMTLTDARGSVIKSSSGGGWELIPEGGYTPTRITLGPQSVEIPIGYQPGEITGGISLQSGLPILALAATDFSHFADPLAYITSGYADATYRRNDVALPAANLPEGTEEGQVMQFNGIDWVALNASTLFVKRDRFQYVNGMGKGFFTGDNGLFATGIEYDGSEYLLEQYLTKQMCDREYRRNDMPLPEPNLGDYYTRIETEEKIRELSQPDGYTGQVVVKDDNDRVQVLNFVNGILKSV